METTKCTLATMGSRSSGGFHTPTTRIKSKQGEPHTRNECRAFVAMTRAVYPTPPHLHVWYDDFESYTPYVTIDQRHTQSINQSQKKTFLICGFLEFASQHKEKSVSLFFWVEEFHPKDK
mmetsp:Transcript_28540/g.43802  ORF Transcript_28540/g.43802 Transcript_28540/m.43802 type:complete len:120 (-) Transcript_28540:339-698(-)